MQIASEDFDNAPAPPRPAVLQGSIWALALPVLAEQFLAMLVGWSDAFLTGRILKEAHFIAAVTVSSYLLWLLECCTNVASIGAQALVARMVGANDIDNANRFALQSLRLAVIVGFVLGGLCWFGCAPLLTAMNLTGEAKAAAIVYLRNIAISCPAMSVLLVGITCLRAAGNTFLGMCVMAVVNVANAFFSWTLTVGLGPIPRLGWAGISVGTSIGFFIGAGIVLWMLAVGQGAVRLPRHRLAWSVVDFRRILNIGVPAATNSVGVVLCQLWFLSLIGRLGDDSLAAHGVATKCESLSYLAAEAFAIAAATLTGQALGAGLPLEARRQGWRAFKLGAFSMSLMGVGFVLFAEQMIWLFVDESQANVVQLGTPLLRLVAFAMPALAATIILTGALRGAGDTRWPLAYNLVGFLLIRIPLTYALCVYGPYGVYGAWTAMLIDLYCRGTFAVLRYRLGGWTLIAV